MTYEEINVKWKELLGREHTTTSQDRQELYEWIAANVEKKPSTEEAISQLVEKGFSVKRDDFELKYDSDRQLFCILKNEETIGHNYRNSENAIRLFLYVSEPKKEPHYSGEISARNIGTDMVTGKMRELITLELSQDEGFSHIKTKTISPETTKKIYELLKSEEDR